MKSLLILLLSLWIVGNQFANAQSAQQLINEAQRAYSSGDVETAKQKFKSALEVDPSNIAAQNYLRTILATEKTSGGEQMEAQLKALILPKVELRDATFGSALEYLRQTANKESKSKTNVSFVVQLPPDFVETQKVTLSLNNVPFTAALHYLCELGGVDYKVEKYAVIIKKKAAEESSSTPSTTGT